MPVKLANNASSTLAASVTTGAASLSIQAADAGKFPVMAGDDWHPATIIDSSGNMEIVRVTARANNVLTVQRAQEGTTAKAFAAGSRIDVRLTAAVISSLPKSKSDIGLSEVDNTSDEDKPISAAQSDAFDQVNSDIGKRLRFDAVQGLTAAQKGQAVANIGGGILAGFRNKIINGDFDIWQRGNGPFSGGFNADRWQLGPGTGATCAVTRVDFVPNAALPYTAKSMLRWNRSVAGSNASLMYQRIENVRTLAGKKCTVSIWAKSDQNARFELRLERSFGTGGSPSASEFIFQPNAATMVANAALKRFDFVFDLSALNGKTFGTNGNDSLTLVLVWLHTDPNATIDISHVSMVEGDATAEIDPFEARHIQQETTLAQRYYQTVLCNARFFSQGGGHILDVSLNWSTMRTTPSLSLRVNGNNSNANDAQIVGQTSFGARFEVTAAGPGDVYSLDRQYGLDAEL